MLFLNRFVFPQRFVLMKRSQVSAQKSLIHVSRSVNGDILSSVLAKTTKQVDEGRLL